MARHSSVEPRQGPSIPGVGMSDPARAEADMVELSRRHCLELLRTHHFGRLGVVLPGGDPVIRPVSYVFDDASHAVVFRTARGSKFHALARATNAVFEIDGTDEASQTGWSVIVGGATEEVTRPSDLARLSGLGLRTWAPGAKPHWIMIRASHISGRSIVSPDDSMPGCYLG